MALLRCSFSARAGTWSRRFAGSDGEREFVEGYTEPVTVRGRLAMTSRVRPSW